MRRIALNLARLGTTVGCGLVMIWLMGRLGTEALALYLIILGLRWFSVAAVQALESALVPFMAASGAMQSARWHAAFVALLTCAAGAVFAALGTTGPTGAGDQHTYWVAIAAVTVIGVFQALAAPGVVRLLLAGRLVAWNGVIVVRRATEVAAFGVASALASESASILPLFFGVWTVLSFVPNVLLFGGPAISAPAVAAPSLGRLLVWTGLGALAAYVMTRAPVIAAQIAYGPDATIAVGLAFILAGYIRQAAGAILAGLDAAVATAVDRTATLDRTTAVLSAGAAATVIAGWVMAPYLLSILAPNDLLASQATTLFRIILLGAAIRCLGDGWGKVLSGAALPKQAAGPNLLAAGVFGVVVAGIMMQASAASGIAGMGWTFSAVQCGAVLGLIAAQIARLSGRHRALTSFGAGAPTLAAFGFLTIGAGVWSALLAASILWAVSVAPAWQAGSRFVPSGPVVGRGPKTAAPDPSR